MRTFCLSSALLLSLTFVGCMEKKKDTGDKVEDAIKKAGDKVGEGADKVIDKTEEGIEKAKKKVKD